MSKDKDDRRVFLEATRDVRPLAYTQRAALKLERPKARALQSRAARSAMLRETLHRPDANSAEDIAFRRPNLSVQAFRRLCRGDYRIEDEIDLHGLRRDEARRALDRFIRDSLARYVGCVRIVHGKGYRSGPGGPVLKANVQDWLAERDEVLAFVSAPRRHGGSGAVDVLLRGR
jgi:DNA-nicking Smr family endonuclease